MRTERASRRLGSWARLCNDASDIVVLCVWRNGRDGGQRAWVAASRRRASRRLADNRITVLAGFTGPDDAVNPAVQRIPQASRSRSFGSS